MDDGTHYGEPQAPEAVIVWWFCWCGHGLDLLWWMRR